MVLSIKHVHTAIFKINDQQVLTVNTWNSTKCYVAAWTGKEFGGENRYMNIMAESLCCSPETMSMLYVNWLYPNTKKKKTKKKKTRKKPRMLISTGSIFRQSSKNVMIYVD